MTRKNKIILAGSAIFLLAVAAAWMYLSDNSRATDAVDIQNLEAVRQASEQAQATAPPPVKFQELPAQPSDGRRMPIK